MDGGQLISESSEARYVPKDAGKLANVDPADIIDRIANGALQREVAAEHGVSQQAVSLFIDRHVPSAIWNQVRRKSIESRIEIAAERIDAADDALVLARARESARLWMWRAEREHPDVWGAKQQIDMRVTTTDLGDRLRAAKERVIGAGSTKPSE